MEIGEVLDHVFTAGWDSPPRPGAICLVLPIKDSDRLRRIEVLYRVTTTTPTDDREWPWELGLEPIQVPRPQRWYDITEEVMRQGLVSLLGTHSMGDIVTHQETLDCIFELLGLE